MPRETNFEDLIHRYGLKPNEHGANLTPPCGRFYTGSSCGQDLLSIHVPLGFSLNDQWSDHCAFRAVWVNTEARAIFTYCEGDLNLTVDATEGEFAVRLGAAAEYYREG